MTHHRSRVCHFVIDCDDLDGAVAFWSAALDATEEPLAEQSRPIYRRLRLPDSEIRVQVWGQLRSWKHQPSQQSSSGP
jgi:hypothetical protein